MAKTNGAASLDQALDELYRASPAEFTGRRDALAKTLKAAGDAAGATSVKAQRKPTLIAYVLNQLARRHAGDVAELVDVGRELARAQRKALRGEAGTDLRDAIARQRSIVSGLTAKTAALMGELGISTTGHLDEIAGALRAALVDPGVGAKLEEGRLDKVPAPAAGFPGASLAEAEGQPQPRKADAKANADADAGAGAKADAGAGAKARADEKRRAASEAKQRVQDEVAAKDRAKQKAAAMSAGAEAAERARIAEAAEREADGHAAQATKLYDEARSLAAEAKRLAAEAKRVGHEADVARRHAEHAATEAARAAKHARAARSDADRAAKRARSVQALA